MNQYPGFLVKAGRLAWAVLRSRKRLVGVVAGASLVGAATYGLLARDLYEARATLFIEPAPLDPSAGNGAGAANRGSDIDLLRSERVAERVVDNEKLLQEPALRGRYFASIEAGRSPTEELAQYLQAHLEANLVGDGSLVQLAVRLDDPHVAMRVANGYAHAWGEVGLELRGEAIRSGVERAQQDLIALRARLGQARAARNDNGDALASTAARADEQFAQIARLTHSRTESGAVAASADVGGAHGDAGGLRADTSDVPTELVPVVPAAAARATSADEEIHLAQQSLERAESRLATIAAEGIGAPFPVHLLRPARLPQASSKPGMALCLAVGAGLALILGLIAVVVAELVDRRVRRAGDITHALGVVVLGKVPSARLVGAAAVPSLPYGERAGVRAVR